MERPGIAALLATVAGMLNAWTLAETQSFATVQSGNIVSAGYYLVSEQWSSLARVTVSIAAFAAGAFVCAAGVAIADRLHRAYSPWILGAESVILLGATALWMFAGVEPMYVAATLSFVAGVQGNAFHRDSGMLYGNVAVTFVLQVTFGYLARAAVRPLYDDGERHLRPVAVYGVVLLGFAGGGAIGFLLDRWSPAASILAAGAIMIVLTVLTASRRTVVDPSQNTPTP